MLRLREAPNGGLVLPADTTTNTNRDSIIALAAKYRLPAVYADRFLVTAGGLMSYETDRVDLYRERHLISTASSTAKSPPTCRCKRRISMKLVINLKTAKALGLIVSPDSAVAADEVIE